MRFKTDVSWPRVLLVGTVALNLSCSGCSAFAGLERHCTTLYGHCSAKSFTKLYILSLKLHFAGVAKLIPFQKLQT